jgi:hypothetical protein
MIRWTFVFPERNVVYEAQNEEDDQRINGFVKDPSQDAFLKVEAKDSEYHLNLQKVCLVARQIVEPSPEQPVDDGIADNGEAE